MHLIARHRRLEKACKHNMCPRLMPYSAHAHRSFIGACALFPSPPMHAHVGLPVAVSACSTPHRACPCRRRQNTDPCCLPIRLVRALHRFRYRLLSYTNDYALTYGATYICHAACASARTARATSSCNHDRCTFVRSDAGKCAVWVRACVRKSTY